MKANNALTAILSEYTNFADIFSSDLTTKLLEHIQINNHDIDLVDGKQLLYKPIDSLGLVELEALKTYIETNLANGFIIPFKSLTGDPIFFVWIPDGSLCLSINY